MAKNYYSSVDEAPMGKGRIDINKKSKSKSKAKKVLRDEKGTFKWERTGTRHGKKKVYLTNFSDVKAKAKKDMTSNKAYPLPFPETFRQAKAKGEKTFRWKNKPYSTQTKAELEAGAKEKEKFIRKGKSNVEAAKAEPKKKSLVSKLGDKVKSFRKKVTGYETQTAWEDAKSKRKIQKRIDSMKKRKNQGKTFSASNLSDLEKQIASM